MVRARTTNKCTPQSLRSSKRIKAEDLKHDKPAKRSRRTKNEEDIPLSEIKAKLKDESLSNGNKATENVTDNMKRNYGWKESKMAAEKITEKHYNSCKPVDKSAPSPKKRKLPNTSHKTAKSKILKAENSDALNSNNDKDTTKSPQKPKNKSNNNSPRKSRKHISDAHKISIPMKSEVDDVIESNTGCTDTPIKSEGMATNDGSDSDDDSDDNIDWEEVQEAESNHDNSETLTTASSSTTEKDKSVEISIEVPGLKGRKRKKTQEDFMTKIKKAIERMKRQTQLEKHKVHLLLLISVGFHRNAVCNQPSIQAFCMSYIPAEFMNKTRTKWQLDDLTKFLTWFKEELPPFQQLKFALLKADLTTVDRLPKSLAEILVATLRSLGLLTRLVSSLQPVPMKILAKSKASTKQNKTPKSTKKVSRKIVHQESSDISPEQGLEKATCTSNSDKANTQSNNITKHNWRKHSPTASEKTISRKTLKKDSQDISTGSKKSSKGKTARKLRRKKKVNYTIISDPSSCSEGEQSDYKSEESSENTSDQDEIFEKKQKFNIKKPKRKSPTVITNKKNSHSKTHKGPSVCELLNDDEAFEVSSKPVIRRSPSQGSQNSSKPVQILSDDSDSNTSVSVISVKDEGSDVWVEVFLPSQKSWFCIDMVSYSVGKPELCEENASQPLLYIIGYDNENKIKDITGRYASRWLSKTQKMRINANWWEETLLPYKTKKKKMDENEDSQLREKHQERPLPQTISEYKSHPLYVLKRHLLKFEAIYPETAATLGFIRGEAIYSRDCVHLLHTREKWMSLEARVVKKGEQPYKIVKGRVKRNQPVVDPNSVTIDLFGRWQTEDYKPPPAKDGIVPRNEYGNVELFKPSMLPPGTKHLQIPGIQKIAKKLGIDGAPAVVGFDFHCGFCHPVIDGLVVCKEHVPTLMDAWRQEQEEAKRKKEQKREKRIHDNWKLIVKSLLIRERLKRKYNSQESRTSSEKGEILEEEVEHMAVAWPQNMKEGKTSVDDDGHCHIFPKKLHKKDKVTGEWTKSCACGLTLPLEK